LTTETDTNSTGVEHGGTRAGVVVRSSEARQMCALACLQEKWSKPGSQREDAREKGERRRRCRGTEEARVVGHLGEA
jgi:hypothetical protein